MNPQMKKGFLEMCILKLISKEDMYGYDILKVMNQYFPEINESAFYAILRRIHKAGVTEVYYVETGIGPKRKYYKLTDIGYNQLEQYVSDWQKLNHISREIGI